MADNQGERRIPQHLDGSWDALEPEHQEALARDRKEDADETAIKDQAFAKFINTKEGQVVLLDLVGICWFHPGFDATLGMDQATALGIQRDGMKALVAYIQHRARRGMEA